MSFLLLAENTVTGTVLIATVLWEPLCETGTVLHPRDREEGIELGQPGTKGTGLGDRLGTGVELCAVQSRRVIKIQALVSRVPVGGTHNESATFTRQPGQGPGGRAGEAGRPAGGGGI